MWGWRYLRTHPLQSLETVGGQVALGVRTVEHFFRDLFTRRFPFDEFIRQLAFMAGTAVLPTLLVTIPVGVTLAIQFGVLAGQVGAESLAGAANGLVVIRQGAPLVAAMSAERLPPVASTMGAARVFAFRMREPLPPYPSLGEDDVAAASAVISGPTAGL